jgi:quercetin dioxygenase-like cupin family protein
MRRILLTTFTLSFAACGGHAASGRHWVEKGEAAPAYRILNGKGTARLLLGPGNGIQEAAVDEFVFDPGASVPEHAHDGSAEILFIQSGAVDMTINGEHVPAGAGDAIYIPAGAKHTARVLGDREAVRAVQVYLPPGPEQRYTQGEALNDAARKRGK